MSVYQTFYFNKATGKKITLAKQADSKYPGDGAFTLVNGVINEKGFDRSGEFIAFNGKDCEAIIDLGAEKEISSVVVNALKRRSSWIWEPAGAEALGSADGINWLPLKQTTDIRVFKDEKVKIDLSFQKTPVRYVKVIIKNRGTIPEGNAGAGSKAWLFVDEIEVE
jgi:hexosaminidase